MRFGPGSCIDNHVKRAEGKRLFEDINSLYGWCMSQFLPTENFHEIELSKQNGRNVLKTILRNPYDQKCE